MHGVWAEWISKKQLANRVERVYRAKAYSHALEPKTCWGEALHSKMQVGLEHYAFNRSFAYLNRKIFPLSRSIRSSIVFVLKELTLDSSLVCSIARSHPDWSGHWLLNKLIQSIRSPPPYPKLPLSVTGQHPTNSRDPVSHWLIL